MMRHRVILNDPSAPHQSTLCGIDGKIRRAQGGPFYLTAHRSYRSGYRPREVLIVTDGDIRDIDCQVCRRGFKRITSGA